jgi:hypothetical protein
MARESGGGGVVNEETLGRLAKSPISNVAIHETGHGIVGKLRGFAIPYLTIKTDSEDEMYYKPEVDILDPEEMKKGAFSFAVTLVAGPLAELIHEHRSSEGVLTPPYEVIEEWKGDLRSFRVTADDEGFAEADILLVAQQTLQENWQAVVRIAAVLDEVRHLEGAALDTLFRREIGNAGAGSSSWTPFRK